MVVDVVDQNPRRDGRAFHHPGYHSSLNQPKQRIEKQGEGMGRGGIRTKHQLDEVKKT